MFSSPSLSTLKLAGGILIRYGHVRERWRRAFFLKLTVTWQDSGTHANQVKVKTCNAKFNDTWCRKNLKDSIHVLIFGLLIFSACRWMRISVTRTSGKHKSIYPSGLSAERFKINVQWWAEGTANRFSLSFQEAEIISTACGYTRTSSIVCLLVYFIITHFYDVYHLFLWIQLQILK